LVRIEVDPCWISMRKAIVSLPIALSCCPVITPVHVGYYHTFTKHAQKLLLFVPAFLTAHNYTISACGRSPIQSYGMAPFPLTRAASINNAPKCWELSLHAEFAVKHNDHQWPMMRFHKRCFWYFTSIPTQRSCIPPCNHTSATLSEPLRSPRVQSRSAKQHLEL
jgi:hypothetical protein